MTSIEKIIHWVFLEKKETVVETDQGSPVEIKRGIPKPRSVLKSKALFVGNRALLDSQWSYQQPIGIHS